MENYVEICICISTTLHNRLYEPPWLTFKLPTDNEQYTVLTQFHQANP